MDTLLTFFGELTLFGNWAFWFVVILLFIMAAIIFFFGKMDYIVPSFTVEEHPLLQKILRFSLLLILVLCLFVECDYFFKGFSPLGKATFVYIAAIFGFYIAMFVYFAIIVIIYCVGKVTYWALDKKWPNRD